MTRLAVLYRSPRLVPALLYHALSALSTMLICSNGLQHVRTAYLFLCIAETKLIIYRWGKKKYDSLIYYNLKSKIAITLRQ
jgi:hypothetical protein